MKEGDLLAIEEPDDVRFRCPCCLAGEGDVLSLHNVPTVRRPGNDGTSCEGGRGGT